MNNYEIAQRFASMWRKSREDANMSQQQVAKMLGVSRSTIQSWEDGVSCPNQAKGFEWFTVLGLSPIPYYLKLIYPAMEDIKNDKDIEEALINCIKDCTPEQKRELLYLFLGHHGSSVAGIIELMTAHLHIPLRDRITIANTVLSSYDLADSLNELVEPEAERPNIEVLKSSLINSVHAVKDRKKSYSLIKEDTK